MQQVMEFTEQLETKVAQIRKEQGTRQREEDATTLPKLEIDESSAKRTMNKGTPRLKMTQSCVRG